MPLAKYGQYIFKDYRLLFFVSALAVYGGLSSPTPDNPSGVEAFILVLFLMVLGGGSGYQSLLNFSLIAKKSKWELALLALFFYGVSIPVVMAIYHNGAAPIIVRDLVGFVFLCLPLFVLPFILKHEKRYSIFLGCVLFVGLFFAIRVLFLDFSFLSKREELLYLANSPLVLFSTLYFVSFVLCRLKKILNLKNFLVIVGAILISILPMAAMYIDFQRASFLAIGLVVLSIFGLGVIKSPIQMLWPAVIVAGIGVIFSPQLMDIIESVSVKTSQVGLNMRYQEWQAVWQMALESPLSLLLGHGWGAHFTSPAVGGLNVSYTHSLLTYMLLKTGLVGLGLTLIYLFFIFEKAVRLVFIEPLKGNALIWPFIIPILLYASYKSLDYGIVLTLILAVDAQVRSQRRDYINKI